jgi:hypothetical protein
MNLRLVALLASTAACALSALAQSAQTESAAPREEELALTLPTDEWYVPKNRLSFGFRVLSSGANVNFGNLGGVTGGRTLVPISAGSQSRIYDNGSVALDAVRANEQLPTSVSPAAGTSEVFGVYPGTGRYQVLIATNNAGTITNTQTADYLSYQAGRSRIWSYAADSQIVGNRVAMSNYTSVSDGATAQKDEGMNGGIEFSLSRNFGSFGPKIDWSVTAGLALNGVNAKTGGTVRATLRTQTDLFQINGTLPTTDARFNNPAFDTLTLPDGSTVPNGLETTVTVNDIPVGPTTTTTVAGAATVQGNWQIKGAYFLMRLGPSVHAQLSERWGLSASAGFAGAFAGTRYSVVEELRIPDVSTPIIDEPSSSESKFLTGYYADVTVDWLATERTGLFAGVAVQQLAGYDQSVGGRTAKIDFGSAVGIRGGINFKF